MHSMFNGDFGIVLVNIFLLAILFATGVAIARMRSLISIYTVRICPKSFIHITYVIGKSIIQYDARHNKKSWAYANRLATDQRMHPHGPIKNHTLSTH